MKPFEEDGKKTEKASKSHRCYLTVVQSLMEEEAIVRAVLSVLLPDMKASQFYTLFKEAFPIACQFPLVQQYIEEDEKNQLEAAVREELQEKHFYCDADIICSALTLYQTMKSSQAVMLIGPSGSGKTTCYSALAGAFNSLAAKTVEERDKDNMIERGSPQLFGCFCEKRGWQDGALTKVLRDSERHEHTLKWLVMDGEPVGQPCWLDYLTTLCSSQDAFLCLSSGETLLSQSKLKLLMEITDLRDASPSVVTRCSLVYFTGNDLWKSVWKREMNTLSLNHKLDHRIMELMSSY
uniref:Dynein heavy chain hydrolytic ATP-binding dynein motor region domain-containing protein n=1 Tax=Amphilophus citrinellus TaxID=61819 RepID=A0A3Q0R7P0_AMPCI